MAYEIRLNWRAGDAPFAAPNYSRAHSVAIAGQSVAASSAPDYGGDPAAMNPEQALAAALSSCHMLTFLSFAARSKWPLVGYEDRAVATLGKNAEGRMAVSRIVLHPRAVFAPGFVATPEQLHEIHERAHKYCFVANALSCDMEILPEL